MAKHWALLAAGIFVFVGCQQNHAPIAQVPPPSFAGPTIAPRAAPAPVTAAPIAPPVAKASGPREWVPSVPPRPWKWIVIHHSASPSGSMAVFDKEHKAKGWDGVGYHFVIGNGTNSGDGQIEVTPRWPIQKWGAHAKTADNRFNEYGIGICLVGNFDMERPTSAQMRSLTRLVAYLMHTYHIPANNVLGHRDTKPTECPGRYVNIAAIRQMASAASGTGVAENDTPEPTQTPTQTASIELVH